MNITYCLTAQSNAETLVAVRIAVIAAMRESLERIGRFDPRRARGRFLTSFDPALCRFIEVNGVRSGFILIRPQADHWLIDHFYILPEHQGKGIGAVVLRDVFTSADARKACRSVSAPCAAVIRTAFTDGTPSYRLVKKSGTSTMLVNRWSKRQAARLHSSS